VIDHFIPRATSFPQVMDELTGTMDISLEKAVGDSMFEFAIGLMQFGASLRRRNPKEPLSMRELAERVSTKVVRQAMVTATDEKFVVSIRSGSAASHSKETAASAAVLHSPLRFCT
jgi:hypothetical protein